MSCTVIRGVVVYEGNTPPDAGAGLLVRIGTRKRSRFDAVGEVRTDEYGKFTFDLSLLPAAEQAPDFYELRVFEEPWGVRLTTHGTTRWRAEVHPGPIVICAERVSGCAEPDEVLPTGIPDTQNDKVYGLVQHYDGNPLSGLVVKVRSVTVTGETYEGTDNTDSNGWYQVTSLTNALPLNLVVRVFDSLGTELLGSSRVRWNVNGLERIDVEIDADGCKQPAEYTRLHADLNAHTGPPAPEAVDTLGIATLSGITGWDVERVSLWCIAHRMGVTVSAVTGDQERLYGLLRVGFPRATESLISRPTSTIQPALDRAAALTYIEASAAETTAVTAFIGRLQAALVTAMQSSREDSLKSILDAGTILSSGEANEVVAAWVAHTGTDAAFWSGLAAATSLDSDDVTEARRLITLGKLALSHAPLVTAILGVIGTNAADAVADLAIDDGTSDDWASIVSAATSLPEGIPSDGGGVEANLAIMLAQHAELMFPSRRTYTALLDGLPNTGDAYNFLNNNATFDIATSRVEDFTGTDAQAAAGRAIQRLYRVAPTTSRAEVIVALEAAGVTSAHSIVRKGRARFIAELNGSLDAVDAEAVYRKATALQAVSATFLAQSHPTFSRSQLRFVPHDPTFTPTSLDDWDNLYASEQACGCEHCRSVLSPSAYLVDLLQWLDARLDSGATDTLYNALVARRPDIPGVKLSCENTERALPYIDLVIEILEAVAFDGTTPFGTDVPQTETTTRAMLAAPQHRIEAVYGTLKGVTNCFALPYSRPLHEARAFLRHLGVPRVELLRSFEGSTDLSVALSAADIDLEQLGMFNEQLSTITADDSSEASYWPVAIADLEAVPTLRWAAGVSWPEVLDLLHSRYANGGAGPMEVVASDWADFSTYTLLTTGGTPAAPAAAELAPIRQLVRFARAMDWSILTADKVLDSVGISSLEGAGVPSWLSTIADLKRLEDLTDLDPVELAQTQAVKMDTWQDRDSREDPEPSVYDRVFLSPSLLTEADPEHAAFLLNVGRTDLQTTGTLADHLPHVAAALGLSQEDLDLLVTQLSATTLNLATLSGLYAWSVVCRAAGLSPRDALALAGSNMANLNPLGSLSDLVSLVELSRDVAAAGWTVDELRYVLLREREEQVGLKDEVVANLLGQVRDAARAAFDALDETSTEASVREVVMQVLAEGLGVEPDALDGLRGATWSSTLQLSSPLDFTAAEAITVSSDTTGAETVTVPGRVTVTLPTGTNYTPTATGISASLGVATTAELTTEVPDAAVASGSTGDFTLAQGGAYSWHEGNGEATFAPGTEVDYQGPVELPSGTLLILDGVGAVTLDSDTADVLLSEPAPMTLANNIIDAVTWTSGVSHPDLLRRFLRDDFRAAASSPQDAPYDDILYAEATYTQDFKVVRALHTAALLLGRLGLDAEERAWWYANASTWSVAAVESLSGSKSDESEPASCTFDQLGSLIRLFAQRQRVPGAQGVGLTTLLEASSDSEFSDALVALTDWSTEDFEGSRPTTVDALEALLDRALIVRRVGASHTEVVTWCVKPTSVTSTLSAAVVSAARSRHDEAAWASVARPVRDHLRRAQRDALVAHLIAADGGVNVQEADDLYERYLIDVSMNPEMLTSRVKQASLSVQLFIHRLMLGLELNGSGDPLFEPTNEDRQEWEWLRTYRLWEAARKVFLYPENWIEPELRDNKTPFFKELESELAQGDATDERVEEAMVAYLDRLREISSLEVLGYYWQNEAVAGADDINVLHVFASTRESPASTWYRRFEDGRTWTAWEEVKCGVEGRLLVPVVHNRRLMLLWASVSQTSDGDSDSTWSEITLSWSEYRAGKWSRKRVSEALQSNIAEYAMMLLSHVNEDGDLVVDVVNRSQGIFGDTRRYGDLGTHAGRFTLDPCTMEFGAESFNEEHVRSAATGTAWNSPGFRTEFDPISAIPLSTELVLHVSEVDEQLQPVDGVEPSEVLVLGDAPRLTLVVPAQLGDFVSQSPFFIQTDRRCWFVRPGAPDISEDQDSISKVGSSRDGTWVESSNPGTPSEDEAIAELASYLAEAHYTEDGGFAALRSADDGLSNINAATRMGLATATYDVYPFYHPHACAFIEAVRRAGPFALLDPDPDGPEAGLRRQQLTGDFVFETELSASDAVTTLPVEDIDFSSHGALSLYNWETFLHLPLYLSSRLADAGRHDEAMKWLHAIFDPRVAASDLPVSGGYEDSARWWKVKPLMDPISGPVTDWIAFTGASPDAAAALAYQSQVEAWRADPFNPHLIARLRPGTYQKVVVMRYLDNLIDWGDQLFTRDTLETVNEAIQLYVYAKRLLGERPEQPEAHAEAEAKTYAELVSDGAFAELGTELLENAYTAEISAAGSGHSGAGAMASLGLTSVFCVPPNTQLISYWDTLDDRLFKVRNGMNIEGVARSLPLFEPPIDPAMLVRAAAAGLDIGSVVDSLNVNLPNHRFQVMHGRAAALAGHLSALGGAMLSALEKQDAAALARLRQEQGVALLDEVKAVREQQLEEAQRGLEALRAGKQIVNARHNYYDKLIAKGWLPQETLSNQLTEEANMLSTVSGGYALVGSILGLLPDLLAGPVPAVETGGEQFGRVMNAYGQYFGLVASHNRGKAGVLSTMAGYARREQEWKQQRKVAKKELAQLEKQLAGAQLRVEIAQKELRNHELQVDHSEQVLDFMTRSFTNEALYQWMVSQLAALYHQAYQLALATAKKAEACYQHELGRSDSFVGSVYWDGLRRGLLAGERLSHDLNRMDLAYLENDRRELELTRHVSLQRLDPMALVRLRSEGECWFDLPEALFDLDCPGHYMRRMVSVGVSVACVSGSQGQVNAELTLHRSAIRTTPSISVDLEEDSTTFPSIVTSRGMDDSGLFQPDLRDPRYLPFERKGVVSTWRLRFCNQDIAQLDWSKVSDVVMHVRYTARDGGAVFRGQVTGNFVTAMEDLVGGYTDNAMLGTTARVSVGLSAKRDEPDALYMTQNGTSTDELTLTLGDDKLPYFAVGRIDKVKAVHVFLIPPITDPVTSLSGTVDVHLPASNGTPVTSTSLAEWPATSSGVWHCSISHGTGWDWPNDIKLAMNTGNFTSIEDAVIILEYTVS